MLRRISVSCVAAAMALTGACSAEAPQRSVASTPEVSARRTPITSRAPDGTKDSEDSKEEHSASPTVRVEYMLVRRVADPATADFASVVETTLDDQRGWEQAGFALVRRDRTRFRIVLAEGPAVDELCLPYDTRATYSCQNGPVVALNADRWRVATPEWTGTLPAYRRMLVNHEVGHLLGQHHPKVQCARPGRLAPIMAQQSTELNGCLPNPWPLTREIARAARHDLPLAPPFEEET